MYIYTYIHINANIYTHNCITINATVHLLHGRHTYTGQVDGIHYGMYAYTHTHTLYIHIATYIQM